MELVVISTAEHKYTTLAARHRNPQSDKFEVETINYSEPSIFHMRAARAGGRGVLVCSNASCAKSRPVEKHAGSKCKDSDLI